MNVKGTRKPQKRVAQDYWQRFNLQTYGDDNLYPQHLINIVGASGTATLCLNRYKKFIEGYGFKDEAVAAMEVNRQGQTMDDLLSLVSEDVARFGGIALHVGYNVFGEVSEVHHVPFEQCRLSETDDDGYVSTILMHPDWTGEKTKNGVRQVLTESNIERFPVFNPLAAVTQMERAGGAAQWGGQILWMSLSGGMIYPTPIYDACVTEISTDEGLGNIKYRNVRNNFMPSCMLVAKRGIPKVDDDGREVERQMISDEDLAAFQGDEKLGKILYVEVENDEDEPKISEFPSRNFDKEFTATDESVVERIYAQFHQEIFHAIRIGKLGFSGDIVRDAYEYYAGEVTVEQRFIERCFNKVFGGYNFEIAPLRYANSERNNV